jgi:hypothetical protein
LGAGRRTGESAMVAGVGTRQGQAMITGGSGFSAFEPSRQHVYNEDFVNVAAAFYERLQECIREEEANLAEDEGLVAVVYLPGGHELYAFGFGYINPNIIRIWGVNPANDSMGCLVAHPNTVQILLRRHKRSTTQAPRRPIGFHGEEDRPQAQAT